MTTLDDGSTRDDLLSAAEIADELLGQYPDLTGAEVVDRLRAMAAAAPDVPLPVTWHLAPGDEGGPWSFCGLLPGPDRATWHSAGSPTELMQHFSSGDRCCPLCVLALGQIAERSASEDASV